MSGRDDRRVLAVPRERVRRSTGPSRPSAVSAGQTSVLANPAALKRDAHEPDYIILVAVVALCAIGILMVYSASAIPSYALSQNTFQLLAPQVLAGLLGLAAMVVLMRIDYRYLRVVSVPLAVLAIVLLVVVMVPSPLSVSVNGSARWLHLGPFLPDVHPAEVAKLALVVYLSHWLATRGLGIRSFWRGTVPFAIIVAPFLILVAREPDLGTASVIVLIAFALFFVAGANFFHLALAGLVGMAGGAALILTVGSYPLHRIQVLLDPWADPQGSGYQTVKGLEALSAGGLFGTGLGNDRIFVPSDVNDFIFSVIAQEMGLVGGAVVIGLFLAFAYAGIRTALRAPDTFGGLVAAGITAWICFQALINIGVVVAVIPVTGITLPFVSAGGSSLTVSLAAVGILLSISRETVERGWISASADSGRGYGGTYIPGSRRRSIAAG
ncbi:MAG: putative peptidoglycan glycosyltransferase FtsW [Candidatus Limnocylindrales bacterium]|jgi:cell division protein FtsW